MSQDKELSNIIRDLRHMENPSMKPSNREWSDMHRRIIQLPRTDRRHLYEGNNYVPRKEVLNWQKACPPDKRITEVGTKSEEDIRFAFEISKKVAIWRGTAEIIECDAVLENNIFTLENMYGLRRHVGLNENFYFFEGTSGHLRRHLKQGHQHAEGDRLCILLLEGEEQSQHSSTDQE